MRAQLFGGFGMMRFFWWALSKVDDFQEIIDETLGVEWSEPQKTRRSFQSAPAAIPIAILAEPEVVEPVLYEEPLSPLEPVDKDHVLSVIAAAEALVVSVVLEETGIQLRTALNDAATEARKINEAIALGDPAKVYAQRGWGIKLSRELADSREWDAKGVIDGALSRANEWLVKEAVNAYVASGRASLAATGKAGPRFTTARQALQSAKTIFAEFENPSFQKAIDRIWKQNESLADSLLENQQRLLEQFEQETRDFLASEDVAKETKPLKSRFNACLNNGNTGGAQAALRELEAIIGYQAELRAWLLRAEEGKNKKKKRA